MDDLARIADINPALIVAGALVVYAAAVALRHTWSLILMGAWTGLVVAMVALPGGHATIRQAQTLRTAMDKGHCVGAALAARVPVRGERELREVAACEFRGAGAGERTGTTAAGKAALARSGRELKRAYGGR